MSLFAELKRRNVFKVAMLYIVVAWLIMQVGDILVPVLVLPDSVLRIVFLILVLGFPPALIFAWAFEITPEGIKRETDVGTGQPIASETGKKLNYLIAGLLIVAIVLLVIDLVTEEVAGPDIAGAVPASVSAVDDGRISVAVLPFINMSPDPDNEYFSDGISEELLNVLVKVESLRVPSRTSSFAFKGEEKPIAEIAQILNVDHVLEGSVRKSGNTVRVTAQLIDVDTDTHLWSDTYDRELTDIFAIQDEIANNIVAALAQTLGAQVTQVKVDAPTENLEAYQLYLRGRYLWWTRYGDAVSRAIQLFQHAVALDPEFARAWSGLATAYIVAPTYTDMLKDEAMPAALEAAQRALALDPRAAEAQAVVAQQLANNHLWQEAVDAYEAAIEMETTEVLPRAWYGLFLSVVGYTRAAFVQFQEVTRLDPINGLANAHLGTLSEFLGRRDDALVYSAAAERAGMMFGIMVRYDIAMREGRFDEAYDIVERYLNAYGATNPCLGLMREVMETGAGWARATECLDAQPLAMSGADWYLPDYDLQMIGRTIEALDMRLTSGGRAFTPSLQWIWGPRGAFIRQSEEFHEFAENNGLVAFWRKRGWPDLCRPVGDTFECD